MPDCSDLQSIDITAFNRDVHRNGFDSGNSDLDEWLIRYAGQNENSFRTRTFFAVNKSGDLLGYYASVFGKLTSDEQVKSMGVSRYSKSVFLIARLAVDTRYQGCGIGKALLSDALSKAMQASEAAGLELIVVEASNDLAVQFYARFGFIRFDEGSNKMFISVKKLFKSK